ncbi:unnamed protein product [Vitrella brassicaformis CCMP3155]|uniref:RING-CH-type domain-containing protein n=1 Tax=Vitrella brassicaformis (strain CCMP3155) TaxID=1169540 RepID=A0A0G4EQL0_VITBC|nr:unnamed protein product [Vitrella brassicaformis CCMP3155]|eukprot:CEL99724.1 unnamed protein product [Vitrella brassicaformis CCMP3155]
MLSWLAQPEPAAVCRFCHDASVETPETGILMAPCGCKGTLRWVHKACLGGWVCAPGNRKSTCDVCLRFYDVGPRGPFCLPVGLIPDALFALAYSLMACVLLLLGTICSCDRSNILARALPLHFVIPTAIMVGLILAAFDWVAGRRHGGSSSLRCGLRMAVALIITLAAMLRVLGRDLWTTAGGLRGIWDANVAACGVKWVSFLLSLILMSLVFLPYCLIKGEKVHQATREVLLRLRHRRASAAAAAGSLFYVREGAYYVLISMWSLAHLLFYGVLWVRFGTSLIPSPIAIALLWPCVRGNGSAAVSLALSMMGLWEPMGKNEVLTNVVSFFVSLSSWITCWIILRLCVIDRVHFLFVEHLRPGAYGSYFNKGNAEERDSLVVTRV